MILLKIISLVLLISYENRAVLCNSIDFQTNVDAFINAFDEAYSTEVNSPTTDEINVGIDNTAETPVLEEESAKQNEGLPVSEPPAVTETVFQPGSDVIHELTDDVRALAERVVASISPQLKLVNVTELISMVTDKVQRSLSMVVARQECEEQSCQVTCRAELLSRDSADEVTWHNCLDSPASNEVARDKRGAVGGFKQVDEAEAKELAEVAMRTLDSIDADDQKRVVTGVLRAQKQLVNGIMYHLTLEVAQSDCKEAEESCDSKLTDPAICKILMQRLFSSEAPHNAQVIKSECNPISKPKEHSIKKNRKRDRRHLGSDGAESNMITNHVSTAKKSRPHFMVGGKTWQDPNSDKIKEISEFALASIDKASNSLNKQTILQVVDARSQVVAGVKYFLKMEVVETNCRKGSDQVNCSPANDQVVQSCEVVVWDKPWEKFRAVTKVDCSPVQRRRTKRGSRPVLGGLKPADPNSPRVQEMASFAVAQLDARSNSLNTQKLIKVEKAQTQVVAGTNYYLTLQLVETNCVKNSPSATCHASPDKVVQSCDVVVYDRPWDKHREMTSANCSAANTGPRNKREVLVGGFTPHDKTSTEIQELAQFAVEGLNAQSNSAYKQTLVEVVSADSQVVAGVNYHLKLRVAETECKKNNGVSAALCTPKTDVPHQECDVIIWSRPWLNKQEITKSDCRQLETKRSVGGPKPVDPADPAVVEAATLSLRAIDRRSNSMYKHALLRVVDAKVQTVSGKKYFLTVEIGQSECTKNHKKENCAVRAENTMNDRCNVVVWDQPWLNKKEVVSLSCGRRNKRVFQSATSTPEDLHATHLSLFEDFKIKYNKSYSNEEEHNKRFRIFRANLKKIQAFQENEQGTAVYGPNMFADLSAKEFKQKYLGLKPGPGPKPSKHHMVPAAIPDVELPVDFDWRDHGAVTPVKNQGQCGSCWAFSVTGNVEGQWFLKHKKLLSLSEQELVDCDKTDNGCNGGYMTSAYEAIEKIGGLETEDEYPYDAEDETCKFNQSEVKATVTSSVNITTNETQIAQWLFKNGPISIGINANAMQFYMGGVSHPFKFLCNKNDLDHGVLLVGFGVHNYPLFHKSLPFWIIKNSWGPKWGEQGYYRVYRGDGTCGVNQMASSAIVG